MTETLFEADERTMENLMEGPWASIEGKTHGLSRRTALFNKSGFEKYSHLIDAYGCDGFAIAPEDVVQGELKAHFSPDFSKIKKSRRDRRDRHPGQWRLRGRLRL
ncbi:hypothetical protein LL962_14045 [Xanthomonas sp. NCPPB 1067]|uniref:hypothetical protein n=1 Tax=Xanthomonas sp. NCPPB 1067 TaxID=487524 RepID=UPI001E361071|nr:hypothetical protein [Xanthomonas sp. NCPPB 1067]MCC4588210.1 hypothetical protein [Xanthomonas sp. NCPPB 1067]